MLGGHRTHINAHNGKEQTSRLSESSNLQALRGVAKRVLRSYQAGLTEKVTTWPHNATVTWEIIGTLILTFLNLIVNLLSPLDREKYYFSHGRIYY